MDIDSTVSTIAATLGGFILLYGACSLIIKEKLYISEACKYYPFYKTLHCITNNSLFLKKKNSGGHFMWYSMRPFSI